MEATQLELRPGDSIRKAISVIENGHVQFAFVIDDNANVDDNVKVDSNITNSKKAYMYSICADDDYGTQKNAINDNCI